jgi:uncharacterized protein (TIGR00730 family)
VQIRTEFAVEMGDRRSTTRHRSLGTVRVGVYCGSNLGTDGAYAACAAELGAELARRGIGVVYGGARGGMMGALADAAIGAGGEVIGVVPRHFGASEFAHDGLTAIELVETMHARKARMIELADGFIALPGGFGTLDEVFELLSWNQLGLVAKPVVFVDVGGYYDALFSFLDRAVGDGLLRPDHRALAQCAGTVGEAIDLAAMRPVGGAVND